MIEQKATAIAERSWCIDEFGLVNAFLAEGEEKCAAIDTGCGYGNIRTVMERLSSKPMIVLLTHKHPDHAGGIYRFRDCLIRMNKDDEHCTFPGMGFDNAFRKYYAESRGPSRCPGMEKDVISLIPEEEPDMSFDFINVEDGSTIDLGGRTLECIHTPGHTDGSICYLDKNNRILFSGDTVNNGIILMRQKDNGNELIEKFNTTLSKLWKREKDFDRLAIGHGGPTIDKSIIHDYLTITEGLLDGSICGKYEERGFRKGDVTRYGSAELWYRCDS